MCGIVGAVAEHDVVPGLLDGLQRLEYRGYDSAGIAVINGHGLESAKSVGKVKVLARRLDRNGISASIGIGHTRWATHGKPYLNNAHPQISNNQVAVVHNGIIENHESLRYTLLEDGYVFQSDTDTEVVSHCIHHYLEAGNSLLNAIQKTVDYLEGSYAIAVVCARDPDRIVAARRNSSLLIGLGEGANYVVSDIAALVGKAQHFLSLEEGDIAEITRSRVEVIDAQGHVVYRPVRTVQVSGGQVDKGDYPHFMLKEIAEQGEAIARTYRPHIHQGRVLDTAFGRCGKDVLSRTRQIHVIACGTSYHAALVAGYLIESLARIPCRVELASEYRYRVPLVAANTLFLTLSQSGETADTLAALRYARGVGYQATLAVCNVPNSSLAQEADLVFLTQAGPEIGVASTKAFTTQLTAINLLAILLGKYGGHLCPLRERQAVKNLDSAVAGIESVLEQADTFEALARRFLSTPHTLFVGRGAMYPIAMEGALKLMEISYIHAQAYAGGELKHGPLALVDPDMPVVALAPNNKLLGKLKANLREIQARGGQLLVLSDEDSGFAAARDDVIIHMPKVDDMVAPVVYSVPLQLLAYHVAAMKKNDVDQPRNLAKSVTVE